MALFIVDHKTSKLLFGGGGRAEPKNILDMVGLFSLCPDPLIRRNWLGPNFCGCRGSGNSFLYIRFQWPQAQCFRAGPLQQVFKQSIWVNSTDATTDHPSPFLSEEIFPFKSHSKFHKIGGWWSVIKLKILFVTLGRCFVSQGQIYEPPGRWRCWRLPLQRGLCARRRCRTCSGGDAKGWRLYILWYMIYHLHLCIILHLYIIYIMQLQGTVNLEYFKT